jgi:predicted RNA binding protein with dsRBD fold (UPF0201 family)
MKVEGSVPIFPTEDIEKVTLCIQNLFPGSDVHADPDRLSFSCSSLRHLCNIFDDQRIRDTAAMVIRRSMVDDSTSFFLNKQAAFVGKANFTEGRSSLGDIRVDVLEGGQEMISAITPKI